MTERTKVPHARPAEGRRAQERSAEEVETPRQRWSAPSIRLWLALVVALIGAALTIVGPRLGLVHNQPAAGFNGTPLLIGLAALAPLVVAAALLTGRPGLASGMLIGSALVAAGQAIADLQFAKDALLASRPDLLVPPSLAPLPAGNGVWVLATGHVRLQPAARPAIRGPARPELG